MFDSGFDLHESLFNAWNFEGQKCSHSPEKSPVLQVGMSESLNEGVYDVQRCQTAFRWSWCSMTCAFIRPLTAEEIAQRREALKQRLAEKKKEETSQGSVSATSELSDGNINLLFV